MRVVHTVAGLWDGTGGPASSIPRLCLDLSRQGQEVVLVTGKGNFVDQIGELRSSIRVETTGLWPYHLAHFSMEFSRSILNEVRECSLVHSHGLWLFPNWITGFAAGRCLRPLVVSPRGMLLPESLKRSRLRKSISWWAFDRKVMKSASLIHATSRHEADAIERLGLNRPIAVIPNGVDTDGEYNWSRIKELKRSLYPRDGGRRLVLFLGRIHPVKGVDLLLGAWEGISAADSGAELVLAGPVAPELKTWLRRKLQEFRSKNVRYVGSIEGRSKISLLARADVVVVPSRIESYGMVVGEALACGVPVITTKSSPWSQLEERECGWWVQPKSQEIARAISVCIGLDHETLDQMGKRGRVLVEEQHSSTDAARQMSEVYSWLTGKGSRPSQVRSG